VWFFNNVAQPRAEVEVSVKKFLSLSILTALAVPSSAFAQDEVVEEEIVVEEEVAEDPPAETVEVRPEYEEEQAEEAAEGGLSYLLFGDVFYQASTTQPNFDDGTGVVRPSTGYSYTDQHGFGLAFAGIDVAYAAEQAGVTISLRWGQGATGLIGYDFGNYNGPLLPTLAQGFVTWTPNDKFTLDAGQFGTIYGAEVAESWVNVNYSRGALYWNLQPFYHVGLRAAYQLNDSNGLKLLVTNGYAGATTTRIEINDVPAIGGQWAFTPNDDMGLYVGYMTLTNQTNSNKDWDHFFDVVYTQAIGDLTLVLNGDANIYAIGNAYNLGGSVAAAYSLTEKWGVGARVEYIFWHDSTWTATNDDTTSLVTATLTARYIPVENLIFSLEGRLDWASDPIFNSRTQAGTPEDITAQLILGMTAQFGN